MESVKVTQSVAVPQYVPCSFVNGNPVRFGPTCGYLVKEEDENELVLSVVRDTYYEHPDAPREAVLSVKEREVVVRARRGDSNYPKLYLLLMAQKECEKICQK